jgi:hypothetical protein
VNVYQIGLALRLPLAATVLEVADQLFLLRVDGDHGHTAPYAILRLGVDVLELRVAIRMLHSLDGLVRRLKAVPCSRSSLATVLSHSEIPCCASISADSVCVLLQVHRNGDSGSPRVTGSISCSNAGHTSGCAASYGRAPALRRTLTTSEGFAPARTSSRPLRTVLIANFVARDTAITPP